MSLNTKIKTITIDPRNPSFVQDTYAAYQGLRDQPAFYWEQFGHLCFARFEDVNALLRDRRFGRQILHVATREELGWPDVPEHIKVFAEHEKHSLLELEPPVHTRLRGLVNRAFLSRQVERLRPKLIGLCNRLMDDIETLQEVDLLPSYATPIPVHMICELLGAPVEMTDQFLKWSHDHVAMYMAKRDRAIEDRAVAAVLAFSRYMRDLIAERRKRPGDDLLSELIAASDEKGKLTEDELVTTAILLLNAGHEATVHSMGNGIKALLEAGHKGPITDAHIEEVLRFDAPLHMFTRYALEDLEYQGYRFKKGETVGLMLGAANRDPARFDNPHKFDASRANNAHTSFGSGIHFCVGAPLARLEMQVGSDMLFQRFPQMKIVGEPQYRDAYHFHGLEALKVRTS